MRMLPAISTNSNLSTEESVSLHDVFTVMLDPKTAGVNELHASNQMVHTGLLRNKMYSKRGFKELEPNERCDRLHDCFIIMQELGVIRAMTNTEIATALQIESGTRMSFFKVLDLDLLSPKRPISILPSEFVSTYDTKQTTLPGTMPLSNSATASA